MHKLSERQERILDFISDFAEEHGYPPSIRDIGQAVGISSTSVVDYNLKVLEREGRLRRDREVSRGLVPNGFGASRPRTIRVPVIGLIAAGEPIEATDSGADPLELSGDLAGEGCYALRVKGKSMIEALIDDGDLVVVRPQDTAENGEIVVALLVNQGAPEGVATLKRLYRERNRVRLEPANAAMDPIYVEPENLRVQGRVVAVLRQLM
jgi:repressor LexA